MCIVVYSCLHNSKRVAYMEIMHINAIKLVLEKKTHVINIFFQSAMRYFLIRVFSEEHLQMSEWIVLNFYAYNYISRILDEF